MYRFLLVFLGISLMTLKAESREFVFHAEELQEYVEQDVRGLQVDEEELLTNITGAPTPLDVNNTGAPTTLNPTTSPTENPTTSPTSGPTKSPTRQVVVGGGNNAIDAESIFVALGIVGIVLFMGVVVYLGLQKAFSGPTGAVASPNNNGDTGKPIVQAAPPMRNQQRDSMSTIYSRDRWSTVSGNDDYTKIEAHEGKDDNLMSLLRDKRHEHNIKRAENPKPKPNRLTLPGVSVRQVTSDTKSMQEMGADAEPKEDKEL